MYWKNETNFIEDFEDTSLLKRVFEDDTIINKIFEEKALSQESSIEQDNFFSDLNKKKEKKQNSIENK